MLHQRYVFVGSVDAGKTTLFNALNGNYDEDARKTQAVEFDNQGGIDTPGEFFSHPNLYRALISATTDADTIVYVHAADDDMCRLPPGLLTVYRDKRVIAVITKVDLAGIDINQVKKMLASHGFAEPIFEVSNQDPASIRKLADYLEQDA